MLTHFCCHLSVVPCLTERSQILQPKNIFFKKDPHRCVLSGSLLPAHSSFPSFFGDPKELHKYLCFYTYWSEWTEWSFYYSIIVLTSSDNFKRFIILKVIIVIIIIIISYPALRISATPSCHRVKA